MLDGRTLFIADTYVNEVPSAQLLAQIALQATQEVHLFGLTPKVAFLSHSNYGSSRRESAARMREAYEIFSTLAPNVECDGEMHADAALSETIRSGNLMDSRLKGEANILICPEPGCGQYPVQYHQGAESRWFDDRSHPHGAGAAGPRADALLHRAAHPVHDRARGGAGAARRAGVLTGQPSTGLAGVSRISW